LWDTLSSFLFWLLFAICCYWYLFFKGQKEVFVLVPSIDDAQPFVTLLVLVLVGRIISVLDILWKQTNVDMFFIDWEKPRGRLVTRGGEKPVNTPVSVWRVLMCANEWNEVQNKRVISMEFTLFWLAFFLVGLELENSLTQSTPSTAKPTCSQSGTNPILRFTVTTFFWLLISLIQSLYVYIIHHRYISDPLGQFVDLLSVSNISLFVLYDKYCGYYVHGRSVHPHSDTHMLELNTNLKKEEENLCSTRGLLPNSSQQVFEMHVTQQLRSHFESIYLFLIHESTVPKSNDSRSLLPSLSSQRGIPTEKLVKAYAAVNKFLSMFLDHSLPDHPYQVREKAPSQKAFNIPPDLRQSSQSILFGAGLKDLAGILFLGVEYDLLLFNILVYSVVDLASNTPISILVTFMVDKLLLIVRTWWGQKNLSTKTLVDSRFLF